MTLPKGYGGGGRGGGGAGQGRDDIERMIAAGLKT